MFEFSKDKNGLPSYTNEEFITHEEKGEFNNSEFDIRSKKFYDMMYNAIVNNEEMEIKPEYAPTVISVIENRCMQKTHCR